MPTIEDLKPKKFTVTVKGVELTCSPLRLSHALIVAKVGEVFQSPKDATKAAIVQAQKDMDEVIAELIPEIADIELDMADTIELITQMTANSQPDDNQYLAKAGVEFNAEKKTKVENG